MEIRASSISDSEASSYFLGGLVESSEGVDGNSPTSSSSLLAKTMAQVAGSLERQPVSFGYEREERHVNFITVSP